MKAKTCVEKVRTVVLSRKVNEGDIKQNVKIAVLAILLASTVAPSELSKTVSSESNIDTEANA